MFELPYGSMDCGHHKVSEEALKNSAEWSFSILLFLPFFKYLLSSEQMKTPGENYHTEEFVITL